MSRPNFFQSFRCGIWEAVFFALASMNSSFLYIFMHQEYLCDYKNTQAVVQTQ